MNVTREPLRTHTVVVALPLDRRGQLAHRTTLRVFERFPRPA